MKLKEKLKALKEFERTQEQYEKLNRQCQDLKDSIAVLEEKKKKSNKEYNSIILELNGAKRTLGEYEGCIELEELGIPYKPVYQNLDKIDNEISKVQRDIGTLLSNNSVCICQYDYSIDGSKAKGQHFQKNYCNNLLIGFNSYFEKKKKAITENNYSEYCSLIRNKFEKACKRGGVIGITINDKYLDLCLKLLKLELEQKIAKAKEKAKIREERKRLKEQEQLMADIAKERAKLIEERKAMDIAFAKALTDKEREQIKFDIISIDKRLGSITYRENHLKAGWLYVISSPSLPGMIKIGCTRRLSPAIRVKELSSSSLPFAYRAHCFVFSDDCFSLENKMHKYFDTKRVAKDREFFYIEPKEAIEVLKTKFHADVHFINEDCMNEGEEE